MDLINYLLLFGVIVPLSILWFYWLHSSLKAESREKKGKDSAESALEIDAPAYEVYAQEALGTKLTTMPDSDFGMFRPIKIDTTKKQLQPKDIERELKVQYKRSIYVEKSFLLKITIAADGKVVTVSKDEKKIDKIDIQKLKFQAFEEEPKVSVELKFAEGDFKINKTKKTQKLSKSEDTIFSFTVTPLKAEDCILTVVFSYKDKIPLFKTSEKVTIDKTVTESGKTTEEHSEQIKMVPVPDDEKEIEIKSIDLKIEVKKLLGLNAKQLDLIKKAAPIALAFVVFVYQVATSDLTLTDAVIAAAPPLLSALGFEGADQLLKGKAEDDSQETA